MAEEKIQDWNGRIIGWVETKADGSRVYKDYYRQIVGRYNPRTGYTTDFYNVKIAKGDQGSMLIYKAHEKRTRLKENKKNTDNK